MLLMLTQSLLYRGCCGREPEPELLIEAKAMGEEAVLTLHDCIVLFGDFVEELAEVATCGGALRHGSDANDFCVFR